MGQRKAPTPSNGVSTTTKSTRFANQAINWKLGKKLAGGSLLGIEGCERIKLKNCVLLTTGTQRRMTTRRLVDVPCSKRTKRGLTVKTARAMKLGCFKGYTIIDVTTTKNSGWATYTSKAPGTGPKGTYSVQTSKMTSKVMVVRRGRVVPNTVTTTDTSTRISFSSGGAYISTSMTWSVYDAKGNPLRHRDCKPSGLCKNQIYTTPIASSETPTSKGDCNANYKESVKSSKQSTEAVATGVGLGASASSAAVLATAGAVVGCLGASEGGPLGCAAGGVGGFASGGVLGWKIGQMVGSGVKTALDAGANVYHRQTRSACLQRVKCIRTVGCKCETQPDPEECKRAKEEYEKEQEKQKTGNKGGSGGGTNGGNISGSCTSDSDCGAGETCDLHLRMCIKS